MSAARGHPRQQRLALVSPLTSARPPRPHPHLDRSSLVQSLHVVFTLYHEFRSNAHFQALGGGGGGGGAAAGGGAGGAGGMPGGFGRMGGGGPNAPLSLGLSDDEEDEEEGKR